MKKYLTYLTAIFLICCHITAAAYERSYNAAGTDQFGTVYTGKVYSNPGEVQVYGDLEDQDGNKHRFDGRWNGFAHVSGIIENQIWVDLDTN